MSLAADLNDYAARIIHSTEAGFVGLQQQAANGGRRRRRSYACLPACLPPVGGGAGGQAVDPGGRIAPGLGGLSSGSRAAYLCNNFAVSAFRIGNTSRHHSLSQASNSEASSGTVGALSLCPPIDFKSRLASIHACITGT